jgi:hypothetical protein
MRKLRANAHLRAKLQMSFFSESQRFLFIFEPPVSTGATATFLPPLRSMVPIPHPEADRLSAATWDELIERHRIKQWHHEGERWDYDRFVFDFSRHQFLHCFRSIPVLMWASYPSNHP